MEDTYVDRVTGGCFFEHIVSFFEAVVVAQKALKIIRLKI